MDFSNVGIESHRHYPHEHSQAGVGRCKIGALADWDDIFPPWRFSRNPSTLTNISIKHHEKEHKLGQNDVRLLHCSNKRSLPTARAPMPTVFKAIPVDILSFHLVRNR